ncbi:MAG: hypothetical protein JNL79_02695 [Myxococcales bacterium]|nr:hypothetical protein [Myxococcales bacterium]
MNAPAPKPPLFPALYVVCARAALVAIVLINLYYAFGASGFAFRGASFSFGRQHDKQLYVVDDRRAFEVWGFGGPHPSISIVKYGDAFPLFRLCGACQTKGGIFSNARFQKGSWIYTDMPWIKGPAAYDLATGELVTLTVPAPKDSKIDPEDVPFYAEHGFTFAAKYRLDADKLSEDYKPVTTVNEMCVVLQAAGFIVLAVVGLIGLVLLPFGLRRRRAA